MQRKKSSWFFVTIFKAKVTSKIMIVTQKYTYLKKNIIKKVIALRKVRIFTSNAQHPCVRTEVLGRTGTSALRASQRACVHPPPSAPYPQHGKLFPDIAISSAHPSATLFAPLRGQWRQKFCQPASVLRTHRSSTFSCTLKWRCGEKSRIQTLSYKF